jgi:hypothetical protein
MAIERKPENEQLHALERMINPTRTAEGPILPPPVRGSIRVPLVKRLQLLRTQTYSGGTQFTLVWDDPEEYRDKISHFNIYVLGLLSDNQTPFGPYTTERSPAEIRVITRTAERVTLVVQTVLFSGLMSDMGISPSVSGETVAATLASSDFPDESVPLSALTPWGTADYILAGNGAGSAPTWKSRGTLDLVLGSSNLTTVGVPVVVTASGEVGQPLVTDIDHTDSPYTALGSDWTIQCDCTTAAIEVDLPTAVGIEGRELTVVKTDASSNYVTIDPDGSETINGDTTGEIQQQHESWTFVSDGANWRIV